MRILYFTRDYTPHDHRFLSALAKTGHKIFYLRLEKRGHTLEDRPLPPEVEQVSWAGGQKPFRFSDAPGLVLGLKRVIRQVKPDLIQSGPIQTAAFLAACSGFRPLVSMSWGYDLLIDADRDVFWRWLTRYTLQHSAAMIGDCETIRQRAVSFGMPGERVVAFPWGVDLRRFRPDEAPAPGSDAQVFTLLSTRGWEPVYGAELIARAFVRAAQQRPELQLVMPGNGSQSSLLRKIFIDGGVLERVHFPGQVSQADLPRYYRSADLYISASHSDGSSISLLEALACGRPVLVSDIPGNREWVTPGEVGWLFPDGDAPAMAERIQAILDQRDQLAEIGRRARCLAEHRADWEKNFPGLLRAYEIAGK